MSIISSSCPLESPLPKQLRHNGIVGANDAVWLRPPAIRQLTSRLERDDGFCGTVGARSGKSARIAK
jgi:hypothetical protein